MSLEQQIGALVKASENLTGAVNGKIGEIDKEVDIAKQEFERWKASADSRYINTSTLKAGDTKVENYVSYRNLGVVTDTSQPSEWFVIATLSDLYAGLNFKLRCLYENNGGDSTNQGTVFELHGSYVGYNRAVTGVGSTCFECRTQDKQIQVRLVQYPKGSNDPIVNISTHASIMFSAGSLIKG